MKKVSILGMVGLVILLFQFGQVFGAQSTKPIKLKWAALEPPESYDLIAYRKVAEIVKGKTNGRIQIELFPGGGLGGRKAMFEALKMGTIDLFGISDSSIAPLDPERLSICGLTYGFRDRDHHRKFLKSSIFQKSQQVLLEKYGMQVLNTEWNWDRGLYRVLISRKPVFVPGDIKGMKLRIQPAEIPRMSWLGIGASPVVIEIAETYIALRQGMVDGMLLPIAELWPWKFTEVLKYITVLDEYPQTIPILMSEKTWKTLSTADQKVMVNAVDEGGRYYTKIVSEGVDKDIQNMLDEHGVSIIKVSLKPWMEKMKPVIKEMENKNIIPKGLYDEVQAIK